MANAQAQAGGKRLILPTILLSLFAGVGLFGTAAVLIDWLQGLATHFWTETHCTIETSEVVDRPAHADFDFRVTYRYFQRGQEYVSDRFRHGYDGFDEVSNAQRIAARYGPGSKASCWVDPDDPRSAYLQKANLWRGFLVFVPLTFVAVGGGMLWLIWRQPWKKSPAAAGAAASTEERKPWKAKAAVVGFFGIFALAGLGMMIPFFIWPAFQVVEARSWTAVDCAIESSQVVSHTSDDSTTYSVEALFNYEVDGRRYRSNRYQFMGGSSSGYATKAEKVARIPAGSTTTCYVNPEDPFDAVIERGFTADYLFGLIPAIFAAVGIGGMVFAWGSFRAAKQQAAAPSWSTANTVGAFGRRAGAPRAPEVATGPQVLEPTMGRFGRLGCSTAIALFWNGIVSIFVWQLVRQASTGTIDWLLALFLLPFVLIGLLLLSGIPYGILALANPRPRLHLSRGALPAGESAQIEWSFRGAASRIRRLKIWLEVHRKTTERHESSTSYSAHSSTAKIEEYPVLERSREHPLDFGAVSFTIPVDALPTSEGDEAISWKLKLQGDIAYWPDVVEEYEIVVLPFAGSD